MLPWAADHGQPCYLSAVGLSEGEVRKGVEVVRRATAAPAGESRTDASLHAAQRMSFQAAFFAAHRAQRKPWSEQPVPRPPTLALGLRTQHEHEGAAQDFCGPASSLTRIIG